MMKKDGEITIKYGGECDVIAKVWPKSRILDDQLVTEPEFKHYSRFLVHHKNELFFVNVTHLKERKYTYDVDDIVGIKSVDVTYEK